jgi:hypothetical protein
MATCKFTYDDYDGNIFEECDQEATGEDGLCDDHRKWCEECKVSDEQAQGALFEMRLDGMLTPEELEGKRQWDALDAERLAAIRKIEADTTINDKERSGQIAYINYDYEAYFDQLIEDSPHACAYLRHQNHSWHLFGNCGESGCRHTDEVTPCPACEKQGDCKWAKNSSFEDDPK